VQETTRRIEQTFFSGQAGQPPVGDRVFTICLSDYSMTVLGEPLLRRVHELALRRASRCGLATREPAERDRGLLAYDLLIGPPRLASAGQSEVVMREPPRLRGRSRQPPAARQC